MQRFTGTARNFHNDGTHHRLRGPSDTVFYYEKIPGSNRAQPAPNHSLTPARQHMKSNFRTAVYFTVVLVALTGPAMATSPNPTTEPLVQPANLVYLGSFQLPQIVCSSPTYACFHYGGTAITYNAADNSLYIVGHPYGQQITEVSIPTPVITSNIANLPTATLLQNFSNALDSEVNLVNPTDPNSHYIDGELVYGGKLIVSVYSYYDGSGTQTTSHFTRPLNLSTTGQLAGPFRVGTQYPGFVSGYMSPIPPEWQSLLGGPSLTGNCCLAIASEQSNGPAVSSFNPSTLGTQNPAPATPLLGYPNSNPVSYQGTQSSWGTTSDIYNGSTKITGVVFPTGTRSVLFFGRQGTGTFCYGPGVSTSPPPSGDCYDPAVSSKGTHAYPYRYQVWAYDANDLLNVKEGNVPEYAPHPYSIWALNLPYSSDANPHLIGGAAYDPATNRIYLSQECVYANCSPIIDVFQVNLGASTTPATAPPSTPTNVISN